MAFLPYPSNLKGYGKNAIPFLHYLNIILIQIKNIRCNFAFIRNNIPYLNYNIRNFNDITTSL